MATTTPNYGWTVPTSTDLVKDGATAIETLGDSVDATVKALNPETTLGDIAYRSSTANTNTRLGIGSSGQVLSVSGGVPAWTTISSGGMTLIASGSFSGDTTLSGISSSYTDLELVLTDVTSNPGGDIDFRINGDTGAVYLANTYATTSAAPTNQWNGPLNLLTTSGNGSIFLNLLQYANTEINKIGTRFDYQYDSSVPLLYTAGRLLNTTLTAAISSITFFSSAGSTITGNYKLYGVK